VHQDPPDCATGALLLAVGAADDESVELVSGVVVVVVVVVIVVGVAVVVAAAGVVRAGVAFDAVAFPCRPIMAAMTAAAAVDAAATAPVTRFTRRLPTARTFVCARSIAMST
jgi:hypothetical protein